MFPIRFFSAMLFFSIMFINHSFSQWEAQNPGFPDGIAPVYFSVVNENVVWVLGGHEVNKTTYAGFSKTIDGGQSWETGSVIADDLQLFRFGHIFALDEKTAWVTMVDDITTVHRGRIFKTTDGGSTWEHQSTAFPDDLVLAHMPSSIHFFDENNGLVIGYYGEHYTTTDGGDNWNLVPEQNVAPISGNEKPLNSNMWWAGDSTVWYGTSKGRIYRTTNRGYNWEAFQVGLGESTVFTSFKDELNGFATTPLYNKKIAKTTDGGESWQILDRELPIHAILVHIKSTENTYMYGSGDLPAFIASKPGSGFTLDEGVTWKYQNDMPLDPLFTANSKVGWAVGSTFDNSMYKWAGPDLNTLGTATSIEDLSSIQNKNGFELSQNYPNPFKINTIIEYDLTESSRVLLNVYSNTGSKVKTIINSFQKSGSYTLEFNADDLIPGVYYYKLKTNKGEQTCKMSIIE